ncbi:adhesion G-protein coupled receptor F1 isoform X4 [Esox lucius]|uniref:adhesion G-protein coupled receptor F1 isoform X4 n=1 Tax=Esox lucius TaxID=8010 RepID=UPI001476FE02|nr:adhesion G-protein coupled receptor F1 isoform X4 [Esox lucius]
MALPKTMIYISVLFILCACLEKQDCSETTNVRQPSPWNRVEVLSREKREVAVSVSEKIAEIEVDIVDIPDYIIELIKATVSGLTYPIALTNDFNVTAVNITTECFPNSTCVCGEQYGWPCDKCLSYGSCDKIAENTCGCINSIPGDGQFCQPISNLTACPSPTTGTVIISEKIAEIEVDIADIPDYIIELIKATVSGLTYPIALTNDLNVTAVNITTECFPNNTCICGDQYGWPCDKCLSYGSCDKIAENTCGCINSIPSDGQFCQPISNLTACPSPTTETVIISEKIAEIEVDIADIPDYIIELIKATVSGLTYPIALTNDLNVTAVNITTECFPNNTCVCEDQYGWPCDKCLSYGSCDKIAENMCGCINSIPSDGQFCQPISNLTACPSSTPAPTATPSTAISPTTPSVKTLDLQLTMDITFDPAFNDENNAVFKDVNQAIRNVYQRNIEGFVSSTLNQFVKGSVIAEYTIKSIILRYSDVANAKAEIVQVLGAKYQIYFTCFNDTVFGNGQLNDIVIADCKSDEVGQRTARCLKNGTFSVLEDTCVLQKIKALFEESQTLVGTNLPSFLERLSNSTRNLTERIVSSPATISTIVNILVNVANVSRSTAINRFMMRNFLETADVLTSNGAINSWKVLNANVTKNDNSHFLESIEIISNFLTNDSFEIETQLIILNKTTFNSFLNNGFNLNSSVQIDISTLNSSFNSITTIAFASMNNVLPIRKSSLNDNISSINGEVVLVKSNTTINNVTFRFDVLNKTLGNPQCVFWNFTHFDGLGGWDDTGCQLQSNGNGMVTCNCNHITSFSILMSPDAPDDPVLSYITFIGVGISMGSLVLCLIIEAIVWNAVTRNNTSYIRHVAIVNIAVSLLIADIWFIIGASISEQDPLPVSSCNAATFFIHFFYLALFFWMLITGLLLLYRTVMVFSHMSKSSMLAIGYTVGYVAPLIIAVITVAATAPGNAYIREGGPCWLNWYQSKALLAFVIPALIIVAINLVILIVVLYKMLRRGVGDTTQSDEKNAFVVIARCLAILTPIFGLTWGLGVGIMVDPTNRGINIVFALFNSLQGFFILVFGTLLDKKIWEVLAGILSFNNVSSNRTRSTSDETLSSSGFHNFLKRRRNVFNVSVPSESGITGVQQGSPGFNQ